MGSLPGSLGDHGREARKRWSCFDQLISEKFRRPQALSEKTHLGLLGAMDALVCACGEV